MPLNIFRSSLIASLVCFLCVAGCDSVVKIKSANEPKTDAEALALVGISMTPAPTVEYRKFEAGLDDSLDLVVRFPKVQMEAFWKASKWNKEFAQSMDQMDPELRKLRIERIQQIGFGQNHPILKALRKSTAGIWCEHAEGSSGGLKIFLSLDQDPEDVIAYIQWFTT